MSNDDNFSAYVLLTALGLLVLAIVLAGMAPA